MAIKHEHVLAAALVALLAVVALQTVQLVGLKNNISGNTIVPAGGAGDSSLLAGETVEQMNQRMHGTSGASAPAASSSAPRQVGGC